MRRTCVPTSTETPIERGSVTRCDGQGVDRGNGSGSRASTGGRPGAALPRVRGPLDPADRRPARSLAGDGQGVLLRPDRREGAGGQGPLRGRVPRLRRVHAAAQRQGRRLRVLQLRREALCRIPGAAGRNSKGCSWVQWLTRIRKVKGTIACQKSGGHAQVSGVRRRGTRVIWRRLDCLKPNLQRMKRRIRRKDACYRRHALRWHSCRVIATFGAWSVAQ